VLHTKSRQEKALSASLCAAGIQNYLPLLRRASYIGRKKVYVDLPLFPSYVFLFGSPDEAYHADRTKRVAKIIRVVDQRRIEWEIENIRLALGKRAPLFPCPYLHEGMQVEVTAGPFKGLQGYVERRKAADKLVIQVESFGRGAYLEIDASLLAPV
jgi:transcription antitermination factor NusG